MTEWTPIAIKPEASMQIIVLLEHGACENYFYSVQNGTLTSVWGYSMRLTETYRDVIAWIPFPQPFILKMYDPLKKKIKDAYADSNKYREQRNESRKLLKLRNEKIRKLRSTAKNE